MKLRIKRFAATAAALLLALCVLAQPTATVQWSDSTAAVGDSVYEITFTGRILDGWHTYDLHSGFSSTVIAFEPSEGVELVGDSFEKVASERATRVSKKPRANCSATTICSQSRAPT